MVLAGHAGAGRGARPRALLRAWRGADGRLGDRVAVAMLPGRTDGVELGALPLPRGAVRVRAAGAGPGRAPHGAPGGPDAPAAGRGGPGRGGA
eukprot:10226735-Lingulodinium_polyedra.AAC.1